MWARAPATTARAAVLLLVVMLIGLQPVAVEAQQVSPRLRSAFQRAETLFRSGRPELAVPPLTTVVDALLTRAEGEPLAGESRALLIRSLAYRADARLAQGERGLVDDDLEQLITLYPGAGIAGFRLSEGVLDRYRRARSRLVGTITFVPFPRNATLRVDGEELPGGTTSHAVLEGTHYVEAFLPGHTRFTREIEVRADRSTEVSFALERISAVVRLMTRPAGATVVIDGNVVGRTEGSPPPDWTPTPELSRYAPHEFSDYMEVEGLMPGRHEVEILLDGYRTFSAPIEIASLSDYQVGAVVLDRNVGTVLLRNMPAGADVWVDDRRTQPEPPARGGDPAAPGAHRLPLPPGQYRITVSEGDSGVFERTVTVADRSTVGLSVDLRPGLTFLGVAGADSLGAESLEERLATTFGELDFWTFLDRGEDGERLLQAAGASAARLRDAATTARAVDWRALQTAASDELPGSMFLVGVLDSDELAAGADLWIWPAAPGPAFAERVPISLSAGGDLEALARRLSDAMSFQRSWAGLELIDSAIANNPVVAAVTRDGPAEAAGVRVGERVLSVAGNDVATSANADRWFGTFPAGATVALELDGPDGERVVELRMASTPTVVPPYDYRRLYSVVWGMTAAAVGRLDARVPSWVAELNQAAVLLHARRWRRAADLLRSIQAPQGPGLGQGMADYWLGIALSRIDDVDGARAAFEAVLENPGARYLRHDGPYLEPMARAHLAALDAAGGGQ